MPLREATYPDLLPASHTLASSFFNEGLFGHFFHPNRFAYPNDVHLFFLRKLREDWALTGHDTRVILSTRLARDGEDGGERQTGAGEVVMGVGVWNRKREVSRAMAWGTAALVKGVEAVNAAESLVWPNRAAAPERFGVLPGCGPFIAHHWSGSRSESWYLDLLGVSPEEGRQGVGRELVNWGFEKAREEGVGCSVIAAEGKEVFYGRCGFDVVVGKAGDEGGEGNPIRREEIGGGVILFWDGGRRPEGLRGYGEV